jgi:outer membrane biosynthesis protein TonB
VHEVISVAPVAPVEIPAPAPVKKPRVKKEKPQPQPQPQQPAPSAREALIQVQPPVSYNYEKIRYLEQENERLKNSLKFNGLSRLQNFSNSMKIKF